MFIVIRLHRLEGTEDKFRNRESRPEDLQTIAELREMVAERESLVKKLVVSIQIRHVLHLKTPNLSSLESNVCIIPTLINARCSTAAQQGQNLSVVIIKSNIFQYRANYIQ